MSVGRGFYGQYLAVFSRTLKRSPIGRGLIIALAVGCLAFMPPEVCGPPAVYGQDVQSEIAAADAAADAEEYTEEELRQISLAERFLGILEKNPRRGTALDRVYGHHIEFGTLDSFIEQLRSAADSSPDDGAKWMVLGLFESQRGEDASAVEEFQKAELLRSDDALAPYYLSQSLLRIGENQAAVDAMERAIAVNPPRVDLLEIFQQLGRVHQRAQRTEQALEVWERLEALFPDDPRVLEQIAVIMAEEGQPALALPRYEKLVEIVDDDYRKTMYRVAAAELKMKTGGRADGITDLESILTDLNPEGWLYRDVRRRIEDVFLRSSDQDSLVKYYESWLEKQPNDVEAMSRLARFLSSSARVPEATEWMEKALKLAPSRTDLRKSFIDQLVEQQKFAEASEQYELLCEADSSNPDYLRDWGKLVLRNRDQPLEARQVKASEIWQKMIDARPEDAVVAAQVADLFRNSDMNPPAMELYRKAVELAPTEPQYREYLGEFQHLRKDTEAALKTWAGIAEPPRRNAETVARVAEVYNSFGYLDQAVAEISAACELDPKDFALQIRAAEYHERAAKYEQALSFVDTADGLADNDEQRETAIRRRIEVYRSSDQLEEQTTALSDRIAAAEKPTVGDWILLAMYQEAGRQWSEAEIAIDAALNIDANSVPALTTAARIYEAAGNLGEASSMCRRLADADRRSRDDHLMNVARLEMQLGRADEALAAANELILAAPGNTDNYEFFSQLCFRLGRNDEGMDALRKAVRINPNEPRLTMALGKALADDLQTREAIELYWRAFDKSDEVEDKTTLVTKLAPLYEQINQFDQMIERFERDRREEDKRRETTICIAQAHQTVGDFSLARYELESLLSENTRDTNLLQQLSKLCQASGDLDGAIDYQRQLVTVAPGAETEYPLANLLQEIGENEEATDILVKLTRREEEISRLLRSLDSLLTRDSYEAVIEIIDPMLSQQRDNWELLYRQGVAVASLDRLDEAKTIFERILAIDLPHDDLGTLAAEQFKRSQQKARSDNLQGRLTAAPTKPSPLDGLTEAGAVQQATGATSNQYNSGQVQRVWTPRAFGVCRMGSLGWLLKFERDAKSAVNQSDDQPAPATVAGRYYQEIDSENPKLDSIYDGLYIATLENDFAKQFELKRSMAIDGGLREAQLFLSSLTTRNRQMAAGSRNQLDEKSQTPLDEADLQLMLDCFEEIQASQEDDTATAMAGNQVIVSGGQTYVLINGQYVSLGTRIASGFVGILMAELELAGRKEEADALFETELAKAEKVSELATALMMLQSQEQFDRMDEFYAKYCERAMRVINDPVVRQAEFPRSQTGSPINVSAAAMQSLLPWIGRLAAEEENQKILELLDSAIDVAVAESVLNESLKKPSRTRRLQSGYARGARYGAQVYYGDKQEYTQHQVGVADQYVNQSLTNLFRQVYYVLERNQVVGDLALLLEKRLESADDQTRFQEGMSLAMVKGWQGENEAALELITQVADQSNLGQEFNFDLASLYGEVGEFERALAIIDEVVPRDQKTLQQRELAAIGVAERLGDVERAQIAAERLFGLRLDSATQLSLIDPMRRLGMSELANAILARAERSAGNQPASLASLMVLYRGQGKLDEAKQLAYVLLRRTKSPLSALASSSTMPRRGSTTPDEAIRKQALQLLNQTGELDGLIEQAKQRIERSPESLRSYEALVEYYETKNDREKLVETMRAAVATTPRATGLKLKLAEVLEATGKTAEACDLYMQILKEKPEWLDNDFYRVQNSFIQANKTDELLKVLAELDLSRFRNPYSIMQVSTQILQRDPKNEAAMTLLERCFDAFPSYRQYMIGNLDRGQGIESDRIFELMMKSVVPTSLDVQQDPWYGMTNSRSYNADGTVQGSFHMLLQSVSEKNRTDELVDSINKTREQAPDWPGGQLMLALVDLKENRRDEAKEKLVALVDDESLKTMPAEVCWFIGQEFVKLDDCQDLAFKVLERAVSPDNNRNLNSQMQYSPLKLMVELCKKTGQMDKARELLVSAYNAPSANNYDVQYSSYQRIENGNWVSDVLLDLGDGVAAVKIIQGLMSDSAGLEAAASWSGQQPSFYQNSLNEKLTRALKTLEDSNASEALEELLVANPKADASTPVLDLLLTVPTVSQLGETSMSSSLVDLIDRLCQEEKLIPLAEQRLADLSEQYPEDLSVAIVRSIVAIRHDLDTREAVLSDLQARLDLNPLAEIPAGRRANGRQQREARLSLPLWLVAKTLIDSEQDEERVAVFGRRAIEAARLQADSGAVASILDEWATVLVSRNETVEAEAFWRELLEIATQRPTRGTASESEKEPTGQNTAAAKPERMPPLTQSQFKLVMRIAESAADNVMVDLSKQAVRESLAGGLPVSDLDINNRNISPAVLMSAGISRAPRLNQSTVLNDSEELVAGSLYKVVSKWKDGAYDGMETYELLKGIVLPENRPDQVLLFPQSSGISQLRVQSLGKLLAEWADAAGKSRDLIATIENRADTVSLKLPSAVLSCMVAMQGKDEAEKLATIQNLEQLTQTEPAAEMLALACQVAIPVAQTETDDSPLKKPAIEMIRKSILVATMQADPNRSAGLSIDDPLAELLNGYLARNGGAKAVAEYYENQMQAAQPYYARYGGDYGLYQQYSDLALVVNSTAKLNLPELTIDYLGRFVDTEVQRYGTPSVDLGMAVVIDYTRGLEPQQRYDFWADWTLPNDDRRTLRMATEVVPVVQIDDRFAGRKSADRGLGQESLLCNFKELVDAAVDADKLDTLREAAEAAVEAQYDFAEYLRLLVVIAAGGEQAETQAEAWLSGELDPSDDENSRANDPSGTKRISRMRLDVAVFQSCMDREVYFGNSFERFDRFENRSVAGTPTLRDANRERFLTELGHVSQDSRQTGLRHWIESTWQEPGRTGINATLLVDQDQLRVVYGSQANRMMFAYPIVGDFDFTADAYHGTDASCDVGFNGVLATMLGGPNRAMIQSVGNDEILYLGQPPTAEYNQYAQLRVRQQDGNIQFFLNGYLVYEEAATRTSPWLFLATSGQKSSSFRNPRFHGPVKIADHVDLITGDSMDGWSSRAFNESQPRHRVMAQKPDSSNNQISYDQQREPSEFDWKVSDGVLVGRGMDGAKEAASWVYYQRPLIAGDAVEYSFFYEGDGSLVSPTIGPLAFIPVGNEMQIRWVHVTPLETALAGVGKSQTVTQSLIEDASFELKPKDWNQVRVAFEGESARISINGVEVYSVPREEILDQRFGLYRDKSQTVKIKDVRLTGDWPTELGEEFSETIFETTANVDQAERRLLGLLMPREIDGAEVPRVIANARSMADADAYASLLAWVVPDGLNGRIRLDYSYLTLAEQAELEGENVWLDRLVCPALELVDLARRLEKLDDVQAVLETVKPGSEVDVRNLRTLNLVLQLSKDDIAAARESLKEIYQSLEKPFDKNMAVQDRIAERLAALVSGMDDRTWQAGLDLALRLLKLDRDTQSNAQAASNEIVGAIESYRNKDQQTSEAMQQWAAVPYFKPTHFASGSRPSTWLYDRGSVAQMPGETWSQLFFQSPLRGKFEIVARRSTTGWKEVAIANGMYGVEPKYDLKAVRTIKVMHSDSERATEVKLPYWDESAEFRIAIDGRKMTTSVNGVEIDTQSYATPLDPWLVIQSHQPHAFVTVRDLRILGSPEIPDEIDLINIAGMASWRTDFYGDWLSEDSDQNSPYTVRSGELVGSLNRQKASSVNESLLMYARPMLEDGEIEFETYYDQGSFEIHPVLGRTAFMLDQEKVTGHELTNAQWSADLGRQENRFDLESVPAEVGLKDGEWNHLLLKLTGDRLQLFVNEVLVAENAVTEPASERFFGLFRYSDKTECRIRNVKYRGDWPKELPTVEDQELAYPTSGVMLLDDSEDLVETLDDLSGKSEQIADPGVIVEREIVGDAEVTLDYENLVLNAPGEGWGCNLSLVLALDDAYNSEVEFSLQINPEGKRETIAKIWRTSPGGDSVMVNEDKHAGVADAGRLRIVRKGSRIHCLFSDADGSFKLLNSLTTGDANIKKISIRSKTSGEDGRISVGLGKLGVRN